MVCFRKKDLHYTYVFCCVVDQNNNIHVCYVVFVEKPLHNTYVFCIISEELLRHTNVFCIFLSKQLPDTVLSSFLTVAAAFIPRHANIIDIMQYDTICWDWDHFAMQMTQMQRPKEHSHIHQK